MCLSKITGELVPDSGIRVGQKLFYLLPPQRYLGEYCGHGERGKWETSFNTEIVGCTKGSSYISGFHILKTKQDVELYRKVKSPGSSPLYEQEVYYRKARLEGTQGLAKVVIADEMFVPLKGQTIKDARAAGGKL